jgi:endonuclease-3 related protein
LLKKTGHLKTLRDPLWWPRSRTFWVIVGAILTQQSKWEKVEQSLENLEKAGIDSLEKLVTCKPETMCELIKPSGFYNTKAKNLQALSRAIVEEFGNFEFFCEAVSREWILAQKGIGQESADSILCYACEREAIVVDAYSARLLHAFGYEFESYESLQAWFCEGIDTHWHKVQVLYERELSLNEVYARFHGKIVEFCKENSKGKIVNIECLGI